MSRLIILSNRVSVPKSAREQMVQGGLAVAMQAALRRYSGLWFGWSGEVNESPGPIEFREADGFTVATLDLRPEDYDEYYNGYANRSLWPLFHNLVQEVAYDRQFERGYFRVNTLFARELAPLLQDDDLLWIHDYHLIPCAAELRRLGLSQRIGFFLHSPFPPPDLLLTLPSHKALMESFFSYDLVGFQTESDLRSFQEYVVSEAGGEVAGDGTVSAYGRTIQAHAFPIGLDLDEFRKLGQSREAVRQEERMHHSLDGRRMMIGVDRLDYTKGIANRFLAYERLLMEHEALHGQLLLLQIAPPSRGDVPEYEELRRGIEHECGRINGHFAHVDWVPLRYVNRGYSRRALAGLFRAAHVGVVTPLKDGMNLVAKEFAAAQTREAPGVLILSRFAGAARELDGALIVNPYDVDALADAMQQALHMPLEERRERCKSMHAALRRNTVAAWRDRFVTTLRETPPRAKRVSRRRRKADAA